MTSEMKIFVVSENGELRSAIDAIAETHGYKVLPYASAEEFLETSDLQGVGCVVASLDLPGMDSVSLQKELADRQSIAPLIILGHAPRAAQVVEALRAGVCDFLELPVDRAALRTSIEHAMRHSAANASNAGDLGPRHSRLTPREREVMRLLSEGKQTKQIAMELSISPKTVEKHRSKVLHKMEAHTVVDLVRMLLRPPTNGC